MHYIYCTVSLKCCLKFLNRTCYNTTITTAQANNYTLQQLQCQGLAYNIFQRAKKTLAAKSQQCKGLRRQKRMIGASGKWQAASGCSTIANTHS